MNRTLAVLVVVALLSGAALLWQVRHSSPPQHTAYQLQGQQLCLLEPELGQWTGAEGQLVAGYANFDVAAALRFYNGQTALAADALTAVSLEVQPAADAGALVLELGGQSVAVQAAAGKVVAALFPGQFYRSHNTATLVVRSAQRQQAETLTDYRHWKLCASPVDAADADWREPVANNIDDLPLGPGVNVMGGEYACVQGWGLHHHVAAGVTHAELARMLDAWQVKTVRLPVNEHCWLADLEGFDQLNPAYTGAAYRASVKALIDLLTLAPYHMHVVLDLHWTGTRQQQALDLKPLPDRDYAAAFWRSAGQLFADNPAVIFNLFNEPHIPGGANADSGARAVASSQESSAAAQLAAFSAAQINAAQAANWWAVWRDGNASYAGMQSLVDAVREAGATNHIAIGGLDYAGDLRGWSSYAPHDPLGKLWADNHAYPAGDKCREAACWLRTLMPIRGQGYGLMFGEAGNSVGQYPQGCHADFVKVVYQFARQHDIPALAWTFLPGGSQNETTNEPRQNSCQIPSVITRWPGESRDGGDLSEHEIEQKRSHDPTPNDWSDDATWAGCATLAYLFGLALSDIADQDPAVGGFGNCGVGLGVSIPGQGG